MPDPAILRGQSVHVWTGTELLINAYGPSNGTVGAAYNPTTNTWRRLPSNPHPQQPAEVNDAVWTGTEMLTFGTSSAAYNPATNTWRALASPPFAGALFAWWTGRQVLLFGGGCCATPGSYLASYDLITDSWRNIAPGPKGEQASAQSVWTGRELVAFAAAKGAAYDPVTGKWRTLARPPALRIDTSMVWTGTEAVIVGGIKADLASAYADGIAFNPTTNTWRTLPAMPLGRFAHATLWTGTHMLVWGGRSFSGNIDTFTVPPYGVTYDPARRSWSAMAKSPLSGRTNAIAVWTGAAMIILGGYGVGAPDDDLLTDGAIYVPEPAT